MRKCAPTKVNGKEVKPSLLFSWLWSMWVVFCLLFTLAFPWYYTESNVVNERFFCITDLYWGWDSMYCSASICDAPANPCTVVPKSWRDVCTDCDKFKTLMTVTPILVGISLFFSLVMCAELNRRVLGKHYEGSRILSVACCVVSLAFLCGATGHFYQDLPGALHVNSFFGSTESPDGQYGTITQTWGGAGWIASVITIAALALQLVLVSITKPGHINNDSHNINSERQPLTHHHNNNF